MLPRGERGADVYLFPRYGERRTVQIRGQTVPPPRPRRRPATRMSSRPDRLALWALLLGLFMIAIAAATAHGETPQHHAAPAAQVSHLR